MKRRAFLASPLLLATTGVRAAAYAPVVPGPPLTFPRDFGSHPEFRIEWWYVTGWVRDGRGSDYGFQVTFFRNRPGVAEDSPSAFAPRQLVLAHAALADPRLGRLRHDQRASRAGFGLADAREDTTKVWIDDWILERSGGGYAARIAARDFAFDLVLAPTQPPLPQGDGGYSRKGPDARQASRYYSEPQLAVTGRLAVDGQRVDVTGSAWLDHEWSSEIMARDGVGWDWVGLNLAGGGALMAFRMRDRESRPLWAGGTLRTADGLTHTFAPDAIRFTPQRQWRSKRTGVAYPVALTVDAGNASYALQPLFDDQELDSRASTGTIYWEGAVRATQNGDDVGRGYLELTGYGRPLQI